MKGTWRRISQVMMVSLVAVGFGLADTPNSPPPGTLNYVEGQVYVQGRSETQKSVGSTFIGPNQQLQTHDGNAEMLLTPGVYLRLGHNSAVTMLRPRLANTLVELDQGSAVLEVDELFKQNNLRVVLGHSTTQIEKQGLYAFTANPASVKVLDGKAVVNTDDRNVKLEGGSRTARCPGRAPAEVR